MKIIIETIPHNEHRYPTVGDYWTDQDGVRHIRVSETKDPRHALLVALHELIESELCSRRGISEHVIDTFDMDYEDKRGADDHSEPGDLLDAPYHIEHVFAGCIERLMAQQLDVNWQEYSDALSELDK